MPSEPHSFAYLFERFPSFVQTFVYREAVEMVRQGMNPWLVSLRHPEDPGDLAEKLDVDVFYAPAEKALRAEVDARRERRQLPGAAHRAIPRNRQEPDSQRMFEAIWLGPLLRERGIRHVHAHFGGVAARTAWWLRKLFGISYSFTGHANDIFCDTDFPVTNADLVRGARLVVTETDYARRWMEEKYPWAKGKVVRVFNGVAIDGFPAKEPASGVPRILSVGRYVEKKGFRDLIEACRLLRARGVDFVCEIVGGGPLEAPLQAQIAEAKLEQQVQLLGPRSQGEVRRLLAAAQVFVLACVPEKDGGSDNLPTVIMEAMLARTPVISTELAGVPEMIAPGEDGLLVPPQSPSALVDAMAKLLADPAAAERLGEQGRVTAEEKFAIEKTARALKHLLIERVGVTVPESARGMDLAIPRRGFFHHLLRFFDK
ncbi:MAG: glycosyltransferase family 4 protein [Chthoniobacter sp.]|uniref:glycosyltransferase family 4 protein n=1 Tax=Chthoniobacter sp. TaxID=2510640 RepID=UPI0032A7B223